MQKIHCSFMKRAATAAAPVLLMLLVSGIGLAHDIKICKKTDPYAPVYGTFEFSVTGLYNPIYVPVGECKQFTAPAGDPITITEKVMTGTELYNLKVYPSDNYISSNLTARTVTIKRPSESQVIVVKFWNRKKTGNQGCTPGFWKNHLGAWGSIDPNAPVSTVFSNTTLNITLVQALQGGGGPGLTGARLILLRAAVAAYVNASNSAVSYPLSTSDVISSVNLALQGDRETMLAEASRLDALNNGAGGCPLGGPETK
jgi:hypothetical protein